MRILVTGSNGMLGSDLVKVLAPHYEVCGLGRQTNRHSQIQYLQTDITNGASVSKDISFLKPAIIIHAAGFTDVDGCELNPYQAFLVNVKGTQLVAEAANAVGATLFFISTDYVFDGTKQSSYQEDDLPNPLSVYGRSKFEAEELLKSRSRSAWIIRSSWLFGKNGNNFFRTILQRILCGEKLRVVNDQKGAPTYTKDLARALSTLIEKGSRAKGCVIYHLANSGETTWFHAAKKILEKTNPVLNLKPISSKELKGPAKRPANSVFDMSKIRNDYGIQLKPWEDALDEYWNEVLKEEWQMELQKNRI